MGQAFIPFPLAKVANGPAPTLRVDIELGLSTVPKQTYSHGWVRGSEHSRKHDLVFSPVTHTHTQTHSHTHTHSHTDNDGHTHTQGTHLQ